MKLSSRSALYFTGTVYSVKENSTGTIAHIYFPPGARTKWHTHEFGHFILCEEGTCLNAIKGGPVIELHAGETLLRRGAWLTGRALRRMRAGHSSTPSVAKSRGWTP
jgi:hypothetical protein